MSRLSEKLRELRAARGCTQREVADSIGAPDNYPSRWEKGKNIPEKWYVAALAEFYGEDRSLLFALREEAIKERDRAKKTLGDVARALGLDGERTP